jgi:hypothetical protein
MSNSHDARDAKDGVIREIHGTHMQDGNPRFAVVHPTKGESCDWYSTRAAAREAIDSDKVRYWDMSQANHNRGGEPSLFTDFIA